MYTCDPKVKTLMQDIYEDAHNNADDIELEILEESEDDILTYDYTQNREVNYHTKLPDKAWLESKMYFTPGVTASTDMMTPLGQPDTISSILMRLDPNLFTCLNHIIFTTEEDSDIDAIAAHLDAEPCEVCEFYDYLGMFWYDKNAVVVNMTTIMAEIKSTAAELHFDKTEKAEETVIGIYSTLIHELRHLALSNPYLDPDIYPSSEEAEDSVEEYCRCICDGLIGTLKQTARILYNIKP